MALQEPDEFSAGPDGAAVSALLTTIAKPPTGKNGNVISGAFPMPRIEDDGSARKKEIEDLKAQKISLGNRLRVAMDQNGYRDQPLRSSTPSLARSVIAQYSVPRQPDQRAPDPGLPSQDNTPQSAPGDPGNPLPASGPPDLGGDPIDMSGATPDILNPGLPAPAPTTAPAPNDTEDPFKNAY